MGGKKSKPGRNGSLKSPPRLTENTVQDLLRKTKFRREFIENAYLEFLVRILKNLLSCSTVSSNAYILLFIQKKTNPTGKSKIYERIELSFTYRVFCC